MFALQNAPLPAAAIARASRSLRSTLPSGTSKFDLTLFATEVPEGLRLTMEYSTDLFDAATVDRMLAHYGLLLEEIVAHPDQPIRALQMLTEEERRHVARGMEFRRRTTTSRRGSMARMDDDLDFLAGRVFRSGGRDR